ncbi:MAG TPA: hypothetical protein VK498_03220 [Ferruginibacter sp.]|nr:hypothetical protein [Ferruginibacter sp.]
MELQKDSFWDCVIGAETLESFKKNFVPLFKFKNEVKEEVLKSFGIVKKLLVHSYYEYDLLDPAMTKALSSFEMALKYRYTEITGKKWKKNLQHLLYYFNDGGYFEFFRKELMDALRNMRNEQSHPKKYFGGGFGLMVIFAHCVDLINDTYEDIELRKLRIAEKEMINISLKEFLENGGMIEKDNNFFIIYDARIYFINNVLSIKKYYGYYKMIFRLKKEQDEINKPTGSLFFFEASDYEIDKLTNAFKFQCQENNSIEIVPILKLENKERFNEWNNLYRISDEDIMFNVLLNHEIDKKWGNIRKELHHN